MKLRYGVRGEKSQHSFLLARLKRKEVSLRASTAHTRARKRLSPFSALHEMHIKISAPARSEHSAISIWSSFQFISTPLRLSSLIYLLSIEKAKSIYKCKIVNIDFFLTLQKVRDEKIENLIFKKCIFAKM